MEKGRGSMKRIVMVVVFAFTMAISFGAVQAFAGSTPDQAKAMVEEAVKYYEANGKEKAFAEFTNKGGKFIKNDLYVFVIGYDGKMLAHGVNQKLVGQDMLELKDANGKAFNVEMLDLAKTKGAGWVDYMWTNPETKKLGPKSSYIQAVKGANLFIGCGIYK